MKEVAKRNIKFNGITGSMKMKAFLETMSNDFHIENVVKHIFIVKPTFAKYTEVDEVYCKVIKLTVPNENRWEELVDFLD